MWNNRLNYTNNSSNSTILNNGDSGEFESYATSPGMTLKMLILQRRDYVIEAIERYTVTNTNKTTYGVSFIKSALFSLFLEISSMLKADSAGKKNGENLYDNVQKKIKSSKFEDLLDAYYIIDDYLYKKKITKIDYFESYDNTVAMEEDERKGL